MLILQGSLRNHLTSAAKGSPRTLSRNSSDAVVGIADFSSRTEYSKFFHMITRCTLVGQCWSIKSVRVLHAVDVDITR